VGERHLIKSIPRSETLSELGRHIRDVKMTKASIGWNLGELEQLAKEEREGDSDDESEQEIERMTAAEV